MPKYWGETNFQPQEFPRSGSKVKDGEKRKRERKKVEIKSPGPPAVHGVFSFSLFLSFLSFAFDPLWGNFRGWKFVSPNILAYLEDISKNLDLFTTKKIRISGNFSAFYGQRLVTAACYILLLFPSHPHTADFHYAIQFEVSRRSMHEQKKCTYICTLKDLTVNEREDKSPGRREQKSNF